MAKDYAKRSHKKKRSTLLTKGWRERLLSVIGILGLVLIFGSGTYYFWKDPTRFKNLYSELTADLFKKRLPVIEKKEVIAAQKPEVQFHFYTELPKMQVPPPSLFVGGDKAPIKEQYVVLVGPFHSASEASEVRVSLLLAGFEVDLVKKDGRFNLQEGPYHSMADAKKMQARIKKKGYENVTLHPL